MEMQQTNNCPDCKGAIAIATGKPPNGIHTATYYSCVACPWFAVERTPEHEAELKPKK